MTVDEINAAQLLGNLTRNQAHAARALLDECPWCENRPPSNRLYPQRCAGDQRQEHDRLDAVSEVTWWRASKGASR